MTSKTMQRLLDQIQTKDKQIEQQAETIEQKNRRILHLERQLERMKL